MYCQLAALTTPTGGKGAYNRKIIAQTAYESYLIVQTCLVTLATVILEQGENGTANEGQPARLHLTSFGYGSIFSFALSF